jgi:hypothetical protein
MRREREEPERNRPAATVLEARAASPVPPPVAAMYGMKRVGPRAGGARVSRVTRGGRRGDGLDV